MLILVLHLRPLWSKSFKVYGTGEQGTDPEGNVPIPDQTFVKKIHYPDSNSQEKPDPTLENNLISYSKYGRIRNRS